MPLMCANKVLDAFHAYQADHRCSVNLMTRRPACILAGRAPSLRDLLHCTMLLTLLHRVSHTAYERVSAPSGW